MSSSPSSTIRGGRPSRATPAGCAPDLGAPRSGDEVEAALIDAVFSVRARYVNRDRKTGVVGAVSRWRVRRGEPANDLRVLDATSPEALCAITNNGKVSRRYKAEVVTDAAAALHKASRLKAQDFRDNQEAAEAAYLSVKGRGPVTWACLGMLSEVDGIKPDIWLKRFVQDRIPNASQEQVPPNSRPCQSG